MSSKNILIKNSLLISRLKKTTILSKPIFLLKRWAEKIIIIKLSKLIQTSLVGSETLNNSEKKKIHFIHFNHKNPTIDIKSHEAKNVIQNGFLLSKDNQIFNL